MPRLICKGLLKVQRLRSVTPFARKRLGVVGAVFGLFIGAFLYAPYRDYGPRLCPLLTLFGLPCPLCGMTRAICALARGQFVEAFQYHALSFPLAICLVAAVPVALYELRAKQCTAIGRMALSRRASTLLSIALVVYYGLRWMFYPESINGLISR